MCSRVFVGEWFSGLLGTDVWFWREIQADPKMCKLRVNSRSRGNNRQAREARTGNPHSSRNPSYLQNLMMGASIRRGPVNKI